MKTYLIAYCVAALFLNSTAVKAQEGIHARHIPLENIELVTDRNIYLNGETIWFSAFYSAPTEERAKSKILYIEIFNSEKKVVLKEKFKIDDNLAKGALHIPDETSTGTYYVRAYTQYQRNFKPESYASIPIQIFNPDITAIGDIRADTNMIMISAVGGTLVHDIPSEIAFRILPDWLPQTDSLFFGTRDSIMTKGIPFYKNGLGKIEFTPQATEEYFVQIKLKNGDTIPKALPAVKKNGLSFRVEKGKKFYKLIGFQSAKTEQNKLIAKVASQEGMPVYQNDFRLTGKRSVLEIPTYIIPEGINYLILEDDTGSLLYAHAFLNPIDEVVELNISTDKKSYDKREKVRLEISDAEDSIAGLLSVAVVKSGTLENLANLSEPLIANPILLDQATFPGSFPDKQIQDQILIALHLYDAYLLDHPPSIVHSDELCRNPGWLAETRGPSISGIVQDKESGEGIIDNKVIASTLFKNQQLHINKSRENGRFDISLAYPEEKQTVYLVAEPSENKKPEILIFNDYSSEFPSLLNAVFSPDTSQKMFFEELLVNKQIRERYAEDFMEDVTVNDLPYWYGKPNSIFFLDDYIEFNTMMEVFHEIITNVRLRTEGDGYYFRVYDDKLNVFYDDPLVLIDNIPVFDINKITKVFPARVERIDIVNRTYILGHRFIRGIISIRTKTNDLAGIEFPDEALFYDYQAPVSGITFPEKEYDERSVSGRLPDFRTVLYWNPGFRTVHDANIDFYTSDHSSDYDIIVRGYTKDGRPCHGRSTIKVGK